TANSGLFLEQRLAMGAPPASGRPDVRAALAVLRHALAVAAEAAGPAPAPVAATAARPLALTPPPLAPDGPDPAPAPTGEGASRALVPVAAPSGDVRRVAMGAMLTLVREALTMAPAPAGAPEAGTVARSNLPPPPYRGAEPVAQPMAPPTLAPDASP